MNMFRATATYGRGFMATAAPDIFSIRIYVGGFAGAKTADRRVAEEIRAFQEAQGYSSHRIINRSYSWIPSYYEYIIQFSRTDLPNKPAAGNAGLRLG